LEHRVYGREGERCLSCKAAIKRIVIAGRSSHYCPKCQTWHFRFRLPISWRCRRDAGATLTF